MKKQNKLDKKNKIKLNPEILRKISEKGSEKKSETKSDKEERNVSLGWENEEITPSLSRRFEEFPREKTNVSLEQKIEPVRNLERGIRNAPEQAQETAKPITYEAPRTVGDIYDSRKAYAPNQSVDRAMPNVTLTSQNEIRFSPQPRTVNNREFERQLGYPSREKDSSEYYISEAKRIEQETGLPFQKKEKRRFL